MDIRTYQIEQLPGHALERWREWCAAKRQFASPFFHPDFVQVVAKVRPGVRVAVIHEGETVVGLLPFEVDKQRVGRPVAGRLSDFQGLICDRAPSVESRELLDGCGLRALHFDHWLADPEPHAVESTIIRESVDRIHESPLLDLSNGFDAFYEKRTRCGSTRLKKVGQLSRKLARECGEVSFSEHDQDPAAMELLKRWKRDQYRRTGALDIFRYLWVLDILGAVSRSESTENMGFRGCMMTYRAAGRILAVHLGMRTSTCVHWWFPAFDPAAGTYSPGLLMMIAGAKYFADQGVERIDLGSGDEAYKKSITLDYSIVAEGVMDRRRWMPGLRRSTKRLWQLLRRTPGKAYFKGATALIHRVRNHYRFRQDV